MSTSKLLSQTRLDGIERDQPVRLSPDDEVLVSVSVDDIQCHLWSVKTGPLQHTIAGFDARPEVVGFSPDSKLLVTKPLHRPVIQVWSVASGKKVRQWDSGAGSMRAARILADNQSMLIASDDLVVRHWNYRTSELLAEKPLKTPSKIHTAEFSPDGQLLVVIAPPGTGDGTVVDITHYRRGTCLAAGSLVETENGPRPVEQLQPGDRVRSFDLQAGRPLLTTVQHVHRGAAPAVFEINSSLSATAEHPVYANGEWVPAADLRQGDVVLGRNAEQVIRTAPRLLRRKTSVADLTVGHPHNFFAGGLLVHNKSVILDPGFLDRWQLFHVVASPYTNQVWAAGEK